MKTTAPINVDIRRVAQLEVVIHARGMRHFGIALRVVRVAQWICRRLGVRVSVVTFHTRHPRGVYR